MSEKETKEVQISYMDDKSIKVKKEEEWKETLEKEREEGVVVAKCPYCPSIKSKIVRNTEAMSSEGLGTVRNLVYQCVGCNKTRVINY